MKITALVENRAGGKLKPVHGLSLYVETARHKLLFDLGPDATLFKNSRALGIDLRSIDTVILSHGHNDHGGALRAFLQLNKTAKVYVQRKAFEPHYIRVLFYRRDAGLDPALASHPQLVPLDGDFCIDEELSLFTVQDTSLCPSPANYMLYDDAGRDHFAHEQNLLIRANRNVLITGCGHTGILNILAAAPARPQVCIGGYHLYNPIDRRTAPKALLAEIAGKLSDYEADFYTCHCTGLRAYAYLSARVPHMHYLSCGGTLHVQAHESASEMKDNLTISHI